jgi:hypothetical protein
MPFYILSTHWEKLVTFQKHTLPSFDFKEHGIKEKYYIKHSVQKKNLPEKTSACTDCRFFQENPYRPG